jgi:hypothetical protein
MVKIRYKEYNLCLGRKTEIVQDVSRWVELKLEKLDSFEQIKKFREIIAVLIDEHLEHRPQDVECIASIIDIDAGGHKIDG